jgi:hypothetical protein
MSSLSKQHDNKSIASQSILHEPSTAIKYVSLLLPGALLCSWNDNAAPILDELYAKQDSLYCADLYTVPTNFLHRLLTGLLIFFGL